VESQDSSEILSEVFLKLKGNQLTLHKILGKQQNGRLILRETNRHFLDQKTEVKKITDQAKPGFQLDGLSDKTSYKFHCETKENRDEWVERITNCISRNRTHGIDLKTVKVDHPITLAHFRGKKEKLEMTVWDFAGQEDYYNSHHHFLTARALYLVTWKITDGQAGLEKLEFWFRSLYVHLKGQQDNRMITIGVVGTHLDQLSSEEEEKKDEREKLVHERAKKIGLQFSFYSEVSCRDNLEGIGDLQNSIFSNILKHSYMGERIPHRYLAVKLFMMKLRSKHLEYPVVSLSSFLEEFGNDKEMVQGALDLFHKWGECVYFANDQSLCSTVVLDPKFLTKMTLSGLFRLGEEDQRKGGIIRFENLEKLWPELADNESFKEKAGFLIGLMEKFDTCFVLADDKQKKLEEQRIVIPSLLLRKPVSERTEACRKHEKERMNFFWPTNPSHLHPYHLERIFKFDVLPTELVSRVIARLHSMVEEACVWRDLVLIQKGQSAKGRIEVVEEHNLFLFEIRSSSFQQGRELMEILMEILSQVADKYPGIQREDYVRSLGDYGFSNLVKMNDALSDTVMLQRSGKEEYQVSELKKGNSLFIIDFFLPSFL